MKFKIILTLLILLFSINNVYGEVLDDGEFYESSYVSRDSELLPYGTTAATGPTTFIFFAIENYPEGFQYVYIDVLDAEFTGFNKSTHDSFNNNIKFKDGATTVASGKIGYYKVNTTHYRIWIWLDVQSWSYTGSGFKRFTLESNDDGYHENNYRVTFFRSSYGAHDQYAMCFGVANSHYLSEIYTIDSHYLFKNIFFTTALGGMSNLFYDKSIVGYETTSIIKVTDSLGNILINETTFNDNDINISHYNINYPYKLECENNENSLFTEYLYFIPPIDPTDCYITTDDIEIGDTINVSYSNIDDLRDDPNHYGNSDYGDCDINLQIIIDRGYYEELIYQDLIIDESDNTFYYPSDTLTTGTYYAQINKVLGSLNDYAVRTTFIISQPANYSILINPNTVYVGDNVNIIYKSLNQSTISLYDNNSNLIKSWVNIQNEGQKIYQIPPDLQYDNSYPNWYVYLNDTGNSSNNYRYNFTVDWRVYTEPEPTPQPTESYYNESIEENIEELKEGINPIKELIFGISTIFVDDPDYNNDNVVDVNEISVWLNSLIGIAIIIFIYILYTVYKRG